MSQATTPSPTSSIKMRLFRRGETTPQDVELERWAITEGAFPQFSLAEFSRAFGMRPNEKLEERRFSTVPLSAAQVAELEGYEESIVLIPRFCALSEMLPKLGVEVHELKGLIQMNVVLRPRRAGWRMVVQDPRIIRGVTVNLPGFETHSVRKASLTTLLTYLYWKREVVGEALKAPYYRARRFGVRGVYDFVVACPTDGPMRVERFARQRGWTDIFEVVPRHSGE